MWTFWKKPQVGEVVEFKIIGMHCTSCSLAIDGDLEDLPGVLKSETNYAKSLTRVEYDPSLVAIEDLRKVITALNYEIQS